LVGNSEIFWPSRATLKETSVNVYSYFQADLLFLYEAIAAFSEKLPLPLEPLVMPAFEGLGPSEVNGRALPYVRRQSNSAHFPSGEDVLKTPELQAMCVVDVPGPNGCLRNRVVETAVGEETNLTAEVIAEIPEEDDEEEEKVVDEYQLEEAEDIV